jgi:archaeal chaperonin
MNSSVKQLFGEGVRKSQAGDSRRYNLLAAALIANLVKNSLGPCGLEKIYIDIMGEVTVTKDGSALLRKVDVEHPAAKILIDAANTVDNEVGDGTTTVVILAGTLLSRAQELLMIGVAPSTIIDGYIIALEIALQTLDRISVLSNSIDIETMRRLAETCLKSKSISNVITRDNVGAADLVVDAVCIIADLQNSKVDIDDIKIDEKLGNSSDIMLIRGTVLDKSLDSSSTRKYTQSAKILLINEDLDMTKTRTDSELRISSYHQLQQYYKAETELVGNKVQNIIDSGANVVISQKGISGIAQQYLSEADVISIRRVKENDMLWLEKSTNAKITRDLDAPIPQENLGHAGRVYEKIVGEDKMVFVDECSNPRSVTLLLRANSKRLLDEYHRSVLDGFSVLRDYILNPRIVGGAGATEVIIAAKVREKSEQITGRVQLVLQRFADALEEIPVTLARNAGMDTVNTIIQLRSKNLLSDRTGKWYGVNSKDRKIDNIFFSVIEPVLVKEQILKTAVEVACMLLRVDDVVMAKPAMQTHSHADGTSHSHPGGGKKHDHYFDRLGKQQRPMHYYY